MASKVCSRQHVTMEELREVQTPEGTRSWHPIPHHQLLESVLDETELAGMKVVNYDLTFGQAKGHELGRVLTEYHEPRHEEFEARTVWSLFNCFTEILKSTNIMHLPQRTRALHDLCDSYAIAHQGPEINGISEVGQPLSKIYEVVPEHTSVN